jgi:hypothetical protein
MTQACERVHCHPGRVEILRIFGLRNNENRSGNHLHIRAEGSQEHSTPWDWLNGRGAIESLAIREAFKFDEKLRGTGR